MVQAVAAAPLRFQAGGKRLAAEPLESADPPPGQLAPLPARDPGHQAQVIVVAALPVAQSPPVADVAVLARLGVGAGSVAGRLFEAGFHPAVVGFVVIEAVLLRLETGARGHHLDGVGPPALQLAQHPRVEAELKEGSRFRMRRQLGVHYLVVVLPEAAAARHPQQHVGAAVPAAVLQPGLGDGVGGRSQGLASGFEILVSLRQFQHLQPLGGEVVQVGALVLHPLLLQHLDAGVVPVGFLQLTPGAAEIELRQVPAGEVVGEVGGGQPEKGS